MTWVILTHSIIKGLYLFKFINDSSNSSYISIYISICVEIIKSNVPNKLVYFDQQYTQLFNLIKLPFRIV